jgi:hypothetical protein
MEWIIGRDGDIKINIPGVSHRHAKLTKKTDGSFILEDLNSTNGTYVNGQQIVCKTITISDKVHLANSIDIDLKPWMQTVIPENDAEFIQNFHSLKSVYDDYNLRKVKAQSDIMTSVMVKRSLPMAIPAIMGTLTLFLGEWGKYAAIIGGVISLIGIIYGIQAASNDQAKLPMKLIEFEDQLRIDYVCPKCKNFLGNLPWLSLYNRGSCQYCKSKWK